MKAYHSSLSSANLTTSMERNISNDSPIRSDKFTQGHRLVRRKVQTVFTFLDHVTPHTSDGNDSLLYDINLKGWINKTSENLEKEEFRRSPPVQLIQDLYLVRMRDEFPKFRMEIKIGYLEAVFRMVVDNLINERTCPKMRINTITSRDLIIGRGLAKEITPYVNAIDCHTRYRICMNDDLYDGEEIKNLGDKDPKGVNDEVEKCIDNEGGEICEEYIDEESEDDRVICEEKDSNNKIEDDQEYSVEEWYEGERDDEWEKDRDEEEMDNGREKECGEFKCYRIGGSMNLKDDNQLLLNYEETDDNRNTWRDPNEVTTSESEESSGSSISSSDSGYGLANNEETDNMIDNRINREVNHEIDRDMNYGINFDSDESYYSHNWDEEELEMLAYEILVSALGEFIEWDTESESEDECG